MRPLPTPINPPARNILDVIDPVASDHSAEVKQAFIDYPHWTIPPDTTVKVAEKLRTGTPACVVLPHNATLTGQHPETSVIQITTNQNVSSGVDNTYAAFVLDGSGTTTPPKQRVANLSIQGSAPTPMTWTNAQAAMFYESSGGTQSIVRNDPVVFDHVRCSAYRGFPIHCEAARVMVSRCNFVDLGNGVNINGARSSVTHSTFERTEGCEVAGVGAEVIANTFVDVFQLAISIGGFFTTNRPEYHSGSVIGNRVYGSTGGGLIVAESMSDVEAIGNYIEDCASFGVQALDMGDYLSNGLTVALNHIVSCGGIGLNIGQDNARVLGNRVYNRLDLSPSFTYCASFAGDGQVIDGNTINPNGGAVTQYAVDFNGCTNLTWGPTNRLFAGSLGFIRWRNSPTFANAEHLAQRSLHGAGSLTYSRHDRFIGVGANANKTITIPSAVGMEGARVTVYMESQTGASTATVQIEGGEAFDDGATSRVIESLYGGVWCEVCNGRWVVVSTKGTVS